MKQDTEVRVTRFEQYPVINPHSTCVGFTINCTSTGGSIYRDTLVPYEATLGVSSDAITKQAWAAVKPSVETWYYNQNKIILGQMFVIDS